MIFQGHFRKRITSIDIANVSENLRKQYRKILEERDQLEITNGPYNLIFQTLGKVLLSSKLILL